MKAFPATGRALRALYDDLFLYVWLSLLWWAGVILVLPAGPATLGLHRVANRGANYKRVDSSYFWQSLRKNIGVSWILFGGSLLTLIGLISNIMFYGNRSGWFLVITVAWMWVMVIFGLMGQFIFPLYCQQDDKRVILVVRNALILAFRNPLFSLLLLILQLILISISIVIPIFIVLIGPAMVALIANFGMAYLLQDMGLAPTPPDFSR